MVALAQLVEAALPVVCQGLPDFLDGYSALAAMQTCKAARPGLAVAHMRRAKEKFERVRSYLTAGNALPPTFCDGDGIEFTLLPLNPSRNNLRTSPNAQHIESFERASPGLSRLNYDLALLACGFESGGPFWKTWNIRGKPSLTVYDLPPEHVELMCILHPAAYYAPERVQVAPGERGPLFLITPPRLVYFGVAFGNFWCVLLVRGVPEESVELSRAYEHLRS